MAIHQKFTTFIICVIMQTDRHAHTLQSNINIIVCDDDDENDDTRKKK